MFKLIKNKLFKLLIKEFVKKLPKLREDASKLIDEKQDDILKSCEDAILMVIKKFLIKEVK
jgi:hypothetical protein